MKSTTAISGIGLVGTASAGTLGNSDNRSKVATSRFAAIGVKFDGLPDEPTAHHDPIQTYHIKDGNQPKMLLHTGRLPSAVRSAQARTRDSSGQSDAPGKKLSDMLQSERPVIKMHNKFYAAGSVRFSEARSSLPRDLTSQQSIARSTPLSNAHRLPEISLTMDGEALRVKGPTTSKTINSGTDQQIELPNQTVELEVNAEGTKEINDPRLERLADVDIQTRTVSKTNTESVQVKPILWVRNHGSVDVYK